jgi:hypothetical protein
MIDKSSLEHLSPLSRNRIWPIRPGICNPRRTTHHQSTSCRFAISYRLKRICDLELRASRISPIELPCPCTDLSTRPRFKGNRITIRTRRSCATPIPLILHRNLKSQFIYPHFLLPAPWTRSPQASKAQPRLAAGVGTDSYRHPSSPAPSASIGRGRRKEESAGGKGVGL